MSRWAWTFKRLRQRIWFRAALISLGGILLAALSGWLGRQFPHELPVEIGQDSVGTILEIMASSMLAVTTFSLTAMVTAYGSATQLATPRATQLLISDPTSQNALSTFLGAFVFSVVGIIGLQTGLYGGQGRIVLFAGTVVLVAVVVVTLLRWISHITAFGRMGDVIDRVEDAAALAMRGFAKAPRLGGRPGVPVPSSARPLFGEEVGYVNHVDVPLLGRLAAEKGLVLHVEAVPGVLAHPVRPLLHVEGDADDETREALVAAFSIERHRTFDQDPRLGVIALSEVASRALAPATNDPGTAIEVLNALLRVLLHLPGEGEGEADDGTELPPVHVPRPATDEILEDAFTPIIREGTAEIEVAIRLTKTLRVLHDALPHASAGTQALAQRLARAFEERDGQKETRAAFARCHREVWGEDG